jgi:anti-sigma factor ChrR (cupin superfamily)
MTENRIIAKLMPAGELALLPYDLEGPVQPEMSWLPLSYDRVRGEGSYYMRMQPGAKTVAHDHRGFEEFLVLEGELIDDDGSVFAQGDFVSFKPGTRHHSWTKTGCLLLVFEWRPSSQAG